MSGEGRRIQWETKQSHPEKSQTPVAKVTGYAELGLYNDYQVRYYHPKAASEIGTWFAHGGDVVLHSLGMERQVELDLLNDNEYM